jgi:hypothetical protein
MPATTRMRRSGAQLSVSPLTHSDIDAMRRDMQAGIRRDVTQDEVVRALMEDSRRLGNVDDLILAAIESLVDDAGGCMTSLPAMDKATMLIKDVISLLSELKAEIEGEVEEDAES